jgi:heme exporter protein B
MKPGSLPAACAALMRRDLTLVWRRRGDALNPILFALIVVALFPLGVGPEPEQLRRMSAGVIFVAILLAGLLALDTLFRSDYEDGSLEQLVLSRHPLSLLLGCRIAVHWLTTALPLIIVAPLFGELLHLADAVRWVMVGALLLSTPLLSLLGAVCVALTVGMHRSGMLLALLVLPLYVPVLIFGAGACNAAQMGLPYAAPLLWLGAALVMALVVAPLACAAALRISLS